MNDATVRQLLAQAQAHLQAQEWAEAAPLYEEVLRLAPGHVQARACLGGIAFVQGQTDAAEYHLTTALAADPTQVKTANNLALLYQLTDRPYLACDLFHETIAQAPEFAEAHYNLGNTLLSLHEYQPAIDSYETALRLNPKLSGALVNLARAYHLTIRLDRCMDCLRRAAEIDATLLAHSNLLFYGLFSPDVSEEQLAGLAEQWDTRFAASLRAEGTPAFDERAYSRDPDRPLRVGYVSPRFFNNSVALMVEPILAGHDRTAFLPYCYSGADTSDAVTERLRALAHGFRDTARLSDQHLAQVIRQDKIDVLIDLNLHMKPSRLGVFARRAAPLQINYLAYPFTSGVKTMDYRVSDAVLDPPGSPQFGPETRLRLQSSYWLYRADPAAPEPADRLPARNRGTVSFASFNFTQKFNPLMAAAWADIVNGVQGSRLLLFADQPDVQQPFIARLFLEAGLDPGRIDLVGLVERTQYLERYRQADLCLDPFPYGGNTTTLDALWMGVPVVALAGQASYLRGSASILSRVGLSELVADSEEEYQKKAVALANNLDQLEKLRQGLRERMRDSVLCDEKGFVAGFERGLRLAWRRYCQGLPPAEINLGAGVPDSWLATRLAAD